MTPVPADRERLRALLHTPSLDVRPPLRPFAIFDGARDPRIAPLAEEDPDARCLYRAPLAPELVPVAPWLVALKPDSPLANLLEERWGESVGIVFEASVDLDYLVRHFRGFLRVRTFDDQRMLFRYYDPRVFRVWAPTMNADDVRLVFGPVRRFVVETEDGRGALVYGRDGTTLVSAIHPLGAVS